MKSVPRIFEGQAVYIIGGGPSLKDFDFSLLEHLNVIAINKAFLSYPESNVLFFMDKRFYKWYEKEIDLFKGLKFTNKPVPVKEDIINLKDTGKEGLETDPFCIRHGNNSGYGAINLAFLMGAKRIYLLGYDMSSISPTQTHFHSGYKEFNVTHNPKVYKDNMIPYFDKLVQPLKTKGIEIYNANKNSKLKCFPFCTLQNALDDIVIKIIKL
jgi:hypothetical protein